MSTFNLIDEPWISVVTDYKGTTKLVGLKEFFQNAHTYIALAGDMPTQDFAVMRFLLAILHTVFSRYDAHGEVYEMIEVNDRMQQVEKVYEEDEEEYEDALMETWRDLWTAEKCPDIVVQYLETWHDRFYLFDEKYPFYQVTEDIIRKCTLRSHQGPADKAGEMSFKTINRLISETGKNTSIFSMVNGGDGANKGKLSNAQLTRWIINFMGYTETPDKIKITSFEGIEDIEKYDGHKGWLYAIGGLHYQTDQLYKTLLLNLVLVHPAQKFATSMQTPAWELTPAENIQFYVENHSIDNLARLYTDYSRAMRISDKENEFGGYLEIIQLPILDKKYNLLECMTIWKKNNKKDEHFAPKANEPLESLWRNFGLVFYRQHSSDALYRIPHIVEWTNKMSKWIDSSRIQLVGLGIEGKTASNTMINEMHDELRCNLEVSSDLAAQGWVVRINDTVEKIKRFIERDYQRFTEDVISLEKGSGKSNKTQYLESVYYQMDKPFRDWLSSIEPNENKDEKINQIMDIFKKTVLDEVKKICQGLSNKFYIGVEVKRNNKIQYKNIATVLNDFMPKIKSL